ncbi:MAG TPA: BTAD domain-containing putative transcriptional regulator [Acidimicrobiales bacterium]
MPDEVLRSRLVDRLERRWTLPVTVIQAGAGFGKSTLLAQAVRANTLAPRGIDVWHACGPGDVDSDRLGSALLRALGVDVPPRGPAEQIAETLAAYSPLDVCLVLDDAHEIQPGSSGAALVDRVVRQLPDNAHVVLAARHTVPAALSRLRAADRLLEIGEHDLLFTADETAAMAARLGRRPEAAIELGGWPALVRLALAVQPEVAIDFAQEEVLSQLAPDQRRALFALAHLGYADADRVRRVVGETVDLAHLARTVPLVSRTDDGRFRAHELWAAALLRVLDIGDVDELRGRVVHQLLADGDLARAGALAMAHEDLGALGRVAREVVRRNTVALPVEVVRPWVDVLACGRPDAPDTLLLRAAFGHALDHTDASVDADLDAATAAFSDQGDGDGQLVALVVATVVAYRRGDVSRLLEVAARTDSVPGSRDEPLIDVALRSIAAIVAEMTGDLALALAELEAAPLARVPVPISTSVQHLLIHCLLLSGRADDALAVARRLRAQRPDRTARYLSAIASWMAGDPSELLALNRSSVDIPAITSRDYFVRRTVVAAMLASTGQRDDVHRLVAELQPVSGSTSNARDAVLDAVARALCAVVDHDDTTAADLITDVVASHADSPILDQHLRRFLPLAYVLDPSVRARWDEASMGPTHEHTRRASRCLVDLRAGHAARPDSLEPGKVFTAFPLPWAVELAARLHGDRHPDGSGLAEWLVDQAPEPARAELRHLVGVDQCGRAAADLLARLPAAPSQPLEISVLGPLQVAFAGLPVTSAELRRGRVRTLLALLVVHRTLSRERATDLLWPDLSLRDGARNLRVTLTYLRQLLEPGRPTGEASFHLRADGSTIALHPSEYLVVDLWELHRLRRDADQNRGQGAPERTIALLEAAIAWWRGEPLADLATVAGHEHEIEHIRVMQFESLLELGELRLVRGDADKALTDAERALALDPYSERAHRLALAAALRSHDRPRIDAVRQRTLTMLDELDVTPEAATEILLRQVEDRTVGAGRSRVRAPAARASHRRRV